MKPNFFLVGAPKCGTTSIYKYLRPHPDIFMSDVKEPHYFNKDHHKSSDEFHNDQVYFDIRQEKQYKSLFPDKPKYDVVGEASVWYLYSEEAAEGIHKFNPDAKILILLREPVSMMRSLHRQFFYSDNEDVRDFRKAVKKGESRRNGEGYSHSVAPKLTVYKDVVDYAPQVQRYTKRFEDVKIVLFDDFVENTGDVYRDILTFLDVDSSFTPAFEVFNKKKVPRYYLLNKILKHPMWRKYLSKINLFSRLKPLGKKLSRWNLKDPKPDDEDYEDIKREMKEKVAELDKIIDQDVVERWGYENISKN